MEDLVSEVKSQILEQMAEIARQGPFADIMVRIFELENNIKERPDQVSNQKDLLDILKDIFLLVAYLYDGGSDGSTEDLMDKMANGYD